MVDSIYAKDIKNTLRGIDKTLVKIEKNLERIADRAIVINLSIYDKPKEVKSTG